MPCALRLSAISARMRRFPTSTVSPTILASRFSLRQAALDGLEPERGGRVDLALGLLVRQRHLRALARHLAFQAWQSRP